MRRILTAVAAFGMLFATPATSEEAETSQVWEGGGWRLFLDHTMDDGCFILKPATALSFRFQQDPINQKMTILLASPRWRSLEEGKTYPVYFQIDSFGAWNADATANFLGDMPSLRFTVSDTAFIDELQAGHTLRFSTGGKPMGDIDLAGSTKALAMLGGCMNERDKLKDPFIGTKSKPPPPIFIPAPKAKTQDPFAT